MDRLTEIEAFATVVDQGGFADAARKMGVSKSAVSKHVASLEARLGTRLLNRTTRRVNPTKIGLIYYDRARRVLSDAGDADAMASALRAMPAGDLWINVDADFGSSPLAPILNCFLLSYRDISLTLEVNGDPIDISNGAYDASIRIDAVQDTLVSLRKLGETTLRMAASPQYLAEYGRPERIDDLTDHRLLHHASSAATSLCGTFQQSVGKHGISEQPVL
jgi:DNA-binding transcriptional LysR family regulator